MFKVNNRNTRRMSMIWLTSFCCFYSYFLTYLTSCSGVSINDFEQVNASQNTINETQTLKESITTLFQIYLYVEDTDIRAFRITLFVTRINSLHQLVTFNTKSSILDVS